jgi:hypothetical protein
MIEKAAPALAAAFVLSRALKSTPVMAASGPSLLALLPCVRRMRGVRCGTSWVRRALWLTFVPPPCVRQGMNEVTGPMAMASGARAVGVGAAGEPTPPT